MRRRDFTILVLGGTMAWPLRIHAQQSKKLPRIGVLLPGTPAIVFATHQGIPGWLREISAMSREGRSRSSGNGDKTGSKTLPGLAAELVRSNSDVLVTGGTQAARALKDATRTIPIVMAIIGDPVAAGLVNSLARPGGNATGFSIVAPELGSKAS